MLVIVSSLALLIAGCGSTLIPEKTAQSVTDFVKENTGFTPKDTKCPDGVDAKVGTEFECSFTGPDGDYTAYVKVTKVEGENVEFYIQTKNTSN
jgi:hypothetical protein